MRRNETASPEGETRNAGRQQRNVAAVIAQYTHELTRAEELAPAA